MFRSSNAAGLLLINRSDTKSPVDDMLYMPPDIVPPTIPPNAAAAPTSPITSISGSISDNWPDVYPVAAPSSKASVTPSLTVIVAPSDNRFAISLYNPSNSTGGFPFINNFSSAKPPTAREPIAITPATLPELIAKFRAYSRAFVSCAAKKASRAGPDNSNLSASLPAIFIKVAWPCSYAPPAVPAHASATSVAAAAVRPAFLPITCAASSANSFVSPLPNTFAAPLPSIVARPPTNNGANSSIKSTDMYSPKNAAGWLAAVLNIPCAPSQRLFLLSSPDTYSPFSS